MQNFVCQNSRLVQYRPTFWGLQPIKADTDSTCVQRPYSKFVSAGSHLPYGLDWAVITILIRITHLATCQWFVRWYRLQPVQFYGPKIHKSTKAVLYGILFLKTLTLILLLFHLLINCTKSYCNYLQVEWLFVCLINFYPGISPALCTPTCTWVLFHYVALHI